MTSEDDKWGLSRKDEGWSVDNMRMKWGWSEKRWGQMTTNELEDELMDEGWEHEDKNEQMRMECWQMRMEGRGLMRISEERVRIRMR